MANNYSKWNSRRWLITVWAIITTTILMFYSIFTQHSPEWMGVALPLLVTIPSVYIAGDSYSKKFENLHGQ